MLIAARISCAKEITRRTGTRTWTGRKREPVDVYIPLRTKSFAQERMEIHQKMTSSELFHLSFNSPNTSHSMVSFWTAQNEDVYDVFRVWGPADLVCFSVPLWLRLPVRHARGPEKKTSHWQAVIFSKNPMMWRFQEFQSMLCSQKLAPSMHQAVSWLTLPVFDLYFFCSRDCFLCLDSISLLCPWCQQVSRRRLRMPVGMSPQSNHPPFSDGKAFKKQLKDIWYGCCNRLLKVVFSLGRPRTPPVFPYLFHAFPKSSRQHAGNVSASRMTAQHELLMEIIQGEMPLDHGTSDTINEWYQRMES